MLRPLLFLLPVFVLSASAEPVQQAFLKASNTDRLDVFGTSVAISGDTVIIGAPGEDSISTGVNGAEADESAQEGGAAYIFARNGGGWVQQAYLKPSNTRANHRFGESVAISGDTVVVGCRGDDSSSTGVNGDPANRDRSGSGAAFVFTRSGATWTQQAYLKASNPNLLDNFGWSVAISGDTIAVGAESEESNATGVNGDQLNNNIYDAGAVYVFTRTGTTWAQQAYLKASNTGLADKFGWSLALSGETLVVGARDERSNATGVDGNQADNSAYNAGAAYVFVRNGTSWSQQAYLKASNTGAEDYFGGAVAISGDTIVVGAALEQSGATGVNGNQLDNSVPYAGAAYVFVRRGTTWSQQAYLKASNTGSYDSFGSSVAVSGDTIVVGAYGEYSNATGINGNQANNSSPHAGAAYVFKRTGDTWAQTTYLKGRHTEGDDQFGASAAVSGDLIVIGADQEASSATGVNGDETQDDFSWAGATYVFWDGDPLTLFDEDRDGLLNFAETYFGSSPTVPNGSPLSVEVAGSEIILRWPEAARDGVRVIPQWSPDLITWMASGETADNIPARAITLSSPGPGVMQASLDATGLSRASLRLHLSRP